MVSVCQMTCSARFASRCGRVSPKPLFAEKWLTCRIRAKQGIYGFSAFYRSGALVDVHAALSQVNFASRAH